MKKCLLTLCSILLLVGCSTFSSSTSSASSSMPLISEWDDDDYYVIQEVMDPDFIPYLYSEEVNSRVEVDEQTGISIAIIDFVGGFNPETVVDDYIYLLELNDFIVDSSVGYGYKEYSLTEDGVVQFEAIAIDDQVIFELVCYRFVDRYESWPQEYFDLMFEYDIPKYESRTYQYSFSYDRSNYNGYYIEISCNKAGKDSVIEYYAILEENGYVFENFAQDMYLAKHIEKEMAIMFYYNAFDDDLFLRVYSYSNWPVSDVKTHLGEVLPRYEETVSFVSYLEVGEEPNTSEVLCIYFDGVGITSLDEYKFQLLNSGWSLVENEEYFLEKMINEENRFIQLVYGTVNDVGSFCIAIY